MGKIVFVTVGTTSFDSLIRVLDSPRVHSYLNALGFSTLRLQIGRGYHEPVSYSDGNFTVEYYRFKDSLAADVADADLVISHAGAGSCIEALGAEKPLIVVINEELMNNHQIELAQQLASESHCIATVCSELPELLSHSNALSETLKNLKSFPRGEPDRFASFLDKIMS